MPNTIQQYLNKHQIPFRNLSLYEQAFVHKSIHNEINNQENYDALEFLGDSLINFVVANYLFQNYGHNPGQLSLYKSFFVSNSQMAKVTIALDLNQFVQASKGTINQKIPSSILADVFESFTAAIYLDTQNFKFVTTFIIANLVKPFLKNLNDQNSYKTKLQEYIQKHEKKLSNIYFVEKKNQHFQATCSYKNEKTTALAKTKKKATEKAAMLLYKKLMNKNNSHD